MIHTELTEHSDGWVDKEGIYYQTKTDYIVTNILDFCNCGEPSEIIIYIRDFLTKLNKKEWGTYGDLSYMFLCYWSETLDLTEHGCTIRCSWLTEKGKEFLEDINWCIDNEITKEEE